MCVGRRKEGWSASIGVCDYITEIFWKARNSARRALFIIPEIVVVDGPLICSRWVISCFSFGC